MWREAVRLPSGPSKNVQGDGQPLERDVRGDSHSAATTAGNLGFVRRGMVVARAIEDRALAGRAARRFNRRGTQAWRWDQFPEKKRA